MHLLRAVHQGEHLVQIDQVLLDFAVDHAQKIERDVNLNHEGIHHDQIAQAQTPIHHPLRGPPQHGHQPDGNDQLLPAVEQRQAGAAFELGAAQLLQAGVVALGLKGFVVEVFDRFVIEQGIDRLGVGRRIKLVGLAAKLDAPFGHRHGKNHIHHQRGQGDQGKADVQLVAQHCEHQQHLDQGGHDVEKRKRHQRFNAAHAALDVAGHAAGLALQVKAQAQAVQVLKRGQRNRAGRAVGGFGEDKFPQFIEQRVGKAQGPVGHEQAHGHHQQRLGAASGHVHGINQLFQEQGHAHVGAFGGHHAGNGNDDAPLVLP